MITARATRDRLKQDKQRLRSSFDAGDSGHMPWLAFHPSFQALWLHRWSHHHHARGNRLFARFLWHLNLLLTGADLSPISDIGPGCLLCHPAGTVFFGRSASRLTLLGRVTVGGGRGTTNIGAGPGLPVLGDDVVLGHGTLVLGAVRIGDRVCVGAGALVITDVPDDCEVCVAPSRIVRPKAAHAADDG